MKRVTVHGLDLSVIDENDVSTEHIYEEIFDRQIYDHRDMRLPPGATIMDVGANIGLYTLWAQRRYEPRAIFCYEASPKTFTCLCDNVDRLIDANVSKVSPINRAIASTAGEKLVLHQSTVNSGVSTLLAGRKVGWIRNASRSGQLETHEVQTSTISAEIEANGLAEVDLLKIDVEGYFMEVLKGISAKDFGRIRNIVAEADYLPETGIKPKELEGFLRVHGYQTDCLDRSRTNNLTIYAWRP